MKQSSIFRQHTYRTLVDWRTDCNRLGTVVVPEVIAKEVSEFCKYAVQLRLSIAIAPLLLSTDRVNNLLKSLKYIVVLAMLLFNHHAEARHVRHHTADVARSVRVYEPPRVEPREVVSVFDSGYGAVRYAMFDVSFLLGFNQAVVNFPQPKPLVVPVVTVPQPPPVIKTIDYGQFLGRAFIASGLIVGLTIMMWPFLHGMTGQRGMQTPAFASVFRRKQTVTLVETRRYLPLWVSTLWCHLKHKLRLR